MKRAFAALCAVAVVSGCATVPSPAHTMLGGRIVALSDGRILPMQIELIPLSQSTGRMMASDPASGEILDGTYTALLSSSYTQQSRPGLFGDEHAGKSVQTNDTAQATATLVGNKGTVINLHMQIKVGNPPAGIGEGEDNKGKKYSVQF